MSGSTVDLKVVLLGRNFAGKSCLVERYFHGNFIHANSTIGAAYRTKTVDVYGTTVKLGIWDTAGSERYETLCKLYYRGAKAAIVCYDLTDDLSFSKAKFWVDELLKHEETCKIYLCGTKLDLVETDGSVRKIDYQTTTDYADGVHAQVFETSSKTGFNIKELFFKIAKDYNPSNNKNENTITLKLTEQQHKKSRRC